MAEPVSGLLTDLSVGVFLDRLAARTPTPGGGAAAGAAGALACALARMVGAYSIGKLTTPADRAALEELLARLTRAEALMRVLIEEDARAYAAYAALPKAADDEAAAAARNAALEAAMTVPLGIAATAAEALEALAALAPRGRLHLLSDLEAAAILAEAAARCAGCSVRVNAALLSDRGRAASVCADLGRIEEHARGRLEAVGVAVRQRIQADAGPSR